MKYTLHLFIALITLCVLFPNPAIQGMDRKVNVYPKGLEGYKPRIERLFSERDDIKKVAQHFERLCAQLQKMSLQEISVNLTNDFSPIFSYLESEDQNDCRLFLELLHVLSETMLLDPVAAHLFTRQCPESKLKNKIALLCYRALQAAGYDWNLPEVKRVAEPQLVAEQREFNLNNESFPSLSAKKQSSSAVAPKTGSPQDAKSILRELISTCCDFLTFFTKGITQDCRARTTAWAKAATVRTRSELYQALRRFGRVSRFLINNVGCQKEGIDKLCLFGEPYVLELIRFLDLDSRHNKFKALARQAETIFTDGPLKERFLMILQEYIVRSVDPTEADSLKGLTWELSVALFYHRVGALREWGVHKFRAEENFSREIDFVLEDAFVECKNIGWNHDRDKVLEQLYNQKEIADCLGKDCILLSKKRIPVDVRALLDAKDIKYFDPDAQCGHAYLFITPRKARSRTVKRGSP